MSLPPKPRRSVLFVPAANPRALEKSKTLLPDVIIFDLEDSAAPEEKAAARERLRDHLKEIATHRSTPEIVVRINALASEFGTEDFMMARGAAHGAGGAVDAILLPKVEQPDDLRLVADALTDTDAPEDLKLWAMIETPKGILAAAAIAETAPATRLGALVVGPNDIVLAACLHPSPDRRELHPWLAMIVLAAKAHGIAAIDGVFNDPSDTGGLAAECIAARAMGFSGKTLIHPDQIAPANQAFRPTEDEIARAKAIVAAFALPQNVGKGVIRLGARMVERLHLLEAERLLAFLHMMDTAQTRADP